jgi:hypothetical protein
MHHVTPACLSKDLGSHCEVGHPFLNGDPEQAMPSLRRVTLSLLQLELCSPQTQKHMSWHVSVSRMTIITSIATSHQQVRLHVCSSDMTFITLTSSCNSSDCLEHTKNALGTSTGFLTKYMCFVMKILHIWLLANIQ